MEKHSRTGRCDYYQDFGHPEARSVRAGFWCRGCKKGMHPKCYYSYHAIKYGVYLDTRYEINKNRARHMTRKQIPREEGTFVWYKVPKDMHSSDDGYGSHGSQNCRHALSSGEEADEENSESGVKTLQSPTQLVLFRCWLFVSCEGGKKNRSVSVWSSGTAPQAGGVFETPPVTRNSLANTFQVYSSLPFVCCFLKICSKR